MWFGIWLPNSGELAIGHEKFLLGSRAYCRPREAYGSFCLATKKQRNEETKEQRNKGMTHRDELRVYIYRAGCSHSLEVVTNSSIHSRSPYLSISSKYFIYSNNVIVYWNTNTDPAYVCGVCICLGHRCHIIAQSYSPDVCIRRMYPAYVLN